MLHIKKYITYYSKIWSETSCEFPMLSKEYPEDKKSQKEKGLEEFLQKIQKFKNVKNNNSTVNETGVSFFRIFKAFLKSVFDFEEKHLNIILSEDFKNVTKDFLVKAHKFDSELKPESIYQGLRNVWIMNGLQLMQGLPVKITPSVFAYSLMYPYSDNFLDNPEVSIREKHLFSEHFAKRLHGEKIIPANFTETQLFRLVEFIEKEFPRDDYPDVYESLYAIQQGQTKSLLLTKDSNLTEYEIQKICFEKGGTSVLADGFLVAGNLSGQQQQILFGYGVFLQILDDIQDMKEDIEALMRTMVSDISAERRGYFVNKAFHFGRSIMEEMICLDKNKNNDFSDLMLHSFDTMLIESVGVNNCFFKTDYVNKLERFSPLHYTFLRKKRAEKKSQRFQIFQKYINTNKKLIYTKVSAF